MFKVDIILHFIQDLFAVPTERLQTTRLDPVFAFHVLDNQLRVTLHVQLLLDANVTIFQEFETSQKAHVLCYIVRCAGSNVVVTVGNLVAGGPVDQDPTTARIPLLPPTASTIKAKNQSAIDHGVEVMVE